MAKEKYSQLIEKIAKEEGIPASRIRATMSAESSFNPRAKSKAGAMGLMQLMPGTAKQLGVTNPWDPEQNIRGGARYLRQMKDKFGRWDLAHAAYNAGPGNVQKYGGVPPFKETRGYVKKIGGLMAPKRTGILPRQRNGGLPQIPTGGKRDVQALLQQMMGQQEEEGPWYKSPDFWRDRMNRLQALGAAFGSGGGRAAREVRQQYLGGRERGEAAKQKKLQDLLKTSKQDLTTGMKEYNLYREQFLGDPANEGQAPMGFMEYKTALAKAGAGTEEADPVLDKLIADKLRGLGGGGSAPMVPTPPKPRTLQGGIKIYPPGS